MNTNNSYIIIFTFLCLGPLTMAAVLPLFAANDFYPATPNDIIPIQPILVYPKSRNVSPYQGRNLLSDNDIIYVKLLNHKGYRPRNIQHHDNDFRELQMKDIFYVKAVTNGQFSTNRLKVYRLPEFYAINVYKKGDQIEK
ncbi:uncharacterized protein LOC142219421 [Haematobia irritans]|uniref:uncharacterized protein LOC142219421 n=1 Tax=Haematobia irritans TaxID=7368 RepID=UPI003F50710E